MVIKETVQGHVLVAVPAQTAVTSQPIDAADSLYGSLQCDWADLTTGTSINATAKVQQSNTGVTGTWKDVASVSINITSANGSDLVVMTTPTVARYYRVNWDGVGVTAGTLDAYLVMKG